MLLSKQYKAFCIGEYKNCKNVHEIYASNRFQKSLKTGGDSCYSLVDSEMAYKS